MTNEAVVDVLEVTVEGSGSADPLAGRGIDSPKAGTTRATFDLDLRGFAIGRERAAVAIEIVHGGAVLQRAPLDVNRPKVAAAHAPSDAGESVGFQALIGLLRLPRDFELELRAELAGGERAPVGRVRGRRAELRTGFEPRLRPLMVTTLGRTGSMMLMRMLEAHPEVLVYHPFRYEQRVASYWIEVLLALAEPASYFRQIAPAGSLDDPTWWLGADGRTPTGLRDEETQRWMGRDAVEELARTSQARIDAFYGQLAARRPGRRPAFFAEKYALGVSRLAWELYPDAREIFLVRDFRDMICSILAFNAQRGVQGFGRAAAASDRDYVASLARWARDLRQSYEQRSERSLVLRYEDLVLEPEAALRRLLEYAGVDHGEPLVREMAATLATDLPELAEHRTATDPRASIGRWRQDLPDDLAEACEEAFGPALEAFGYERLQLD